MTIQNLDTIVNSLEKRILKAVEKSNNKYQENFQSVIKSLSSNIEILNANMTDLLKIRDVERFKKTQDDITFVSMMTEVSTNITSIINKVGGLENKITEVEGKVVLIQDKINVNGDVEQLKNIVGALPCQVDHDLYAKIAKFNSAYAHFDVGKHIFLILDNKGNIVLTNSKCEEILGKTHTELIGLNWIENFVPEEDKSRVTDILNTIANGDTSTVAEVTNKIIGKTGLANIKWRNNVVRDNGSGILATIGIGEIIESKRES